MESTMLQLLWAFVGGVFGILLPPLWEFVASRRGELTGTWRQIIPPFEGEPEKLANVKLRQVGDRLKGTTHRTAPRLEFEQEWKVEARMKRGFAFGMYWPKDTARLPGSYGTLQFKIVDENRLEGFYVRVRMEPEAGNNQTRFRECLKTIPIQWERR